MNMVKCEECGKKLGFFEGYRHPTMGRSHFICSNCFDSVHESVVKWREANLPYVGFFNNRSSNKSFQLNFKNRISDLILVEKMDNNRAKENCLNTGMKTLI